MKRYGTVSQVFHWSMAFLIIGMLVAGFVMTSLDKTVTYKYTIYAYHKQAGLFILTLAALRLLWTLRVGHLPLTELAWWERFLAKISHGLLYLLMFAIPLSGWVMSTAAGHVPKLFGCKFPFPAIAASRDIAQGASNAHEVLAYLLIAVLLAHVLGAWKHHLIDKNDILRRMLPRWLAR